MQRGGERMVKMNMQEKQKCEHQDCFHSNSKHYHGLCWEITQPDERGVEIYCPCTFQGEKHRLYSDLEYMTPGPLDQMITKQCRKCGDDVVMNLIENFCITCKSGMGTLK